MALYFSMSVYGGYNRYASHVPRYQGNYGTYQYYSDRLAPPASDYGERRYSRRIGSGHRQVHHLLDVYSRASIIQPCATQLCIIRTCPMSPKVRGTHTS